MDERAGIILVTGATGYVGGRLIPRLLDAGYRVRAMVRDRERLLGRPWSSQVDIIQADVLQPETLPAAMKGVTAAYYLVHSLHGSSDTDQSDITAARHFGAAAFAAGVRRIIALSALAGPEGAAPGERATQEPGAALRSAGVPVTELRAALIIGSGSVAFEIIRNVSERTPVMICPRWIYTRVQPVAIRDVLSYLIAALGEPQSTGQVIDIGGADTQTFAGMITAYSRARGLRRAMIPVPVVAPRLSAFWVHWLTPIPARLARPIIDSLRREVVVREGARRLFPEIHPLDYATAMLLAVERTEAAQVETSWSDALATSQGDAPTKTLTVEEGIIIEQRQRLVAAPPASVFKIFTGLGGNRGWLYLDWTWWARGVMDRLVGGVGFRRGRRHPDQIYPGDALDFWRVERVEENHLLRLRAEMKVPGRAWLEFRAEPQAGGMTSLTQRAFFVPKGLSGLAYWYVLYPIHGLIFSGLIREIGRRAERLPQA